MSFETTKIKTSNKLEFYQLLHKQVIGLMSTEKDMIANAANLSSLLFHSLEQVNWVGFYFINGNDLVLGPFQGQVACTRIKIGQGVCGKAFEKNEIMRIDNVNTFDGHIVCDAASASEVVIPLSIEGELVGVLDIDSPILSRFNKLDETSLAEVAKVFCRSVAKK